MRSRTDPGSPLRCQRCLLLHPFCLCASIPRVETRTEVLVVRHFLESTKTTNTARLAMFALPNARMVDYGKPDEPFDDGILKQSGTWLVFPDGAPAVPEAPLPKRLVVLDGTWSQARRMMQRVPALWKLPRLSLSATLPERNLRRPHFKGGLSTLSAIAEALALIEGEEVAEPLRALQALAYERVLQARGAPVT